MRSVRLGFFILVAAIFTAFAATGCADDDHPSAPQEMMIPMADGVQLAADIYFPAGFAPGDKLPVILEYLPYRKTEGRGYRWGIYSYFLDHGYIVARVDIRGTGNSEGRVIPYEYSEVELVDGEQVIDWLANQPWSSGNVGMFGISWGGFNSIQMAVRNPPALKAFIALMATEALYEEDVHYIDGIMHTDSWMMSNDLDNSLPGAPDYELDEDWLINRFEAEPSVYTYMRNQRDGPFWDRASALSKYDQIKVPGFHIGGWYDGYRDSLPRMLEHVKAPVKAMIGPWDHDFPHDAVQSPRMEWRHEAVRWFDHWLKGNDTGIMVEPKFAVYVRDWNPPGPEVEHIAGNWRWEDGWPIKRGQTKSLYATDAHTLEPSQGATESTHTHRYKASMGLEGGGPVMWWGSITPDQRPMDAESLIYDSAALDAPMEILGMPRVQLNVSASAPRANWVVRISDVAPDGRVTQVGGGAMNGTHRNSARTPEDIIPGEIFPLAIDMHFTSWTFQPGHKIRLAISNAMWPMLWPTPYPMTTTLAIGGPKGARLDLPTVPHENRPVPNFLPPAAHPTLAGFGSIEAGNDTGYAEIDRIQRDPETGGAWGVARNRSASRYPWGISRFEESIEHRTSDKDPAHTSVTGIYAVTREVPGRVLRVEQDVRFSSNKENFRLIFVRRFLENGKLKHEKTWDEVIPRDYQ